MNLYEFITTADQITFYADNDKVALVVSLLIGNGAAFCKRCDDENIKIPSNTVFNTNSAKEIDDFLGQPLAEFIRDENNEILMSNALNSFAYVSPDKRKSFDKELSKHTTPRQINDFKTKHEDKKRISLQRYVNIAWSYGRSLENKIKTQKLNEN